MKISVSNIAWYRDPKKIESFLEFISDLGCSGLELAPSAIWNEPLESTKEDRLELRKKIENYGLNLLGFHSLLYSKPELQFFKSAYLRKKTKTYLFSLIDLCSELGGKNLVYGSPKSRELCGRKFKECKKQIIDDFYEIAEYSKTKGIFLFGAFKSQRD